METTRNRTNRQYRRSRQYKRSRNNGALLATVAFVFVLGLCIAIYAIFANLFTSATTLSTTIAAQNETAQSEYLQPIESVELPVNVSTFATTPMHISNINDTGYLALINRMHAIETNTNMLVSVWPTIPVSFIDGMYLHPTALQAVADMISTSRNADVGSFFVSSGFRCQDTQAVLYNDGANRAFALPPGHSEHHTGLAIDILAIGISQSQMANSREGRWLADNSYRYGLILRYPEGVTHITGIEFEPWHFRYVGRPHAYYMRQNNLVLEEYIELIQNTGGFSFEMNGRLYHVLHQIPQEDMINVSVDLEFIVSNDNMGGFILTAWE